jgi:proliferating cell nuclear antigen
MSNFVDKTPINISNHITEGNVLTIQTVQIAPFRTLMTALKDILLETNITFEPEGIKIINMDKSHTILAHLFLEAQNFEFYECKKDKIIIGVNMFHLFKLINSIDNDDTLTIYIENGDYVDGIVSHLALKFENGEIKQCKTQKLRLIEPEPEELQYPDVKFSSIINLPSADFQKIIRDLSCISDKLEIKSVGNELIFKCSGQFASAEIHRTESDGSMGFITKQDSSKIIQGEFSLKNLGYFIKCTNLCSQIEIYLENDLPLVVKYDVASLGSIRLCLSVLPST